MRASIRELLRTILRLLSRHAPDSIAYQIQYFRTHHRFCRFRRPKRFTEKIFWRMRYPSPVLATLADRVGMRDYVRDIAGEEYLVPLYGVTHHMTADQLRVLPAAFVVKATHSAGQVRVVRNRDGEDLEVLAATANAWLDYEHHRSSGEKHYAAITPRLLLEKALLADGRPPPDYKFHVFNPADGAQPFVFIQVIGDREGEVTHNLFLEDWTRAPFRLAGKRESEAASLTQRPDGFEEMLAVATALARPFGYCRVDLYHFDGRTYVGELTFTPSAGRSPFTPPEWDEKLGALFGWPEKPQIPIAKSTDAKPFGQGT